MKFKLTSSQKIFYTRHWDMKHLIWNHGALQTFPQVYSYEQLNNAFNDLVKNQGSLLVRFKESETDAYMCLQDFEYTNYPFIQLSSEEDLEAAVIKALNEPIDLSDRLVNCTIFRTPSTSGIIINSHHIVVDGYSGLIMAEHVNNYLKNPDYVPPVSDTYQEYVAKEQHYKQSKRFIKNRQYWLQQFASEPNCNITEKDTSDFDFTASELSYDFPSELFSRIKAFAEKHNVSLASFFNMIYSTYFHRRFDVNNFTIGTPVLNRTTQSELNTIGLYMHILPLIVNITEGSFIENIKNLENSHMNLLRYQNFTQYDILELLKENGKNLTSLYDVVADYEEYDKKEDYDLSIRYNNTLSVPMEMHFFNTTDNPHLKIRYKTSVFNQQEIQTMLSSFIAIIEDAIENPDKKITDLEMLSAEENQKVIYEFNTTASDYAIPKESTLYSLFETTAKAKENKICIKTTEKNLTFGELLNISERLDTEIRKITNAEKAVIAIIAERSPEMYGAIYGIIRGGNAYLPIDPDYPQDRIDFMLQNSEAKAVVAQGKFAHLAGNIPCINMTSLLNKVEAENNDISVCCAEPDDTAYVIYTSGSTGTPKGAKVSHKSAVNRILWMHDKYPLSGEDVILQKTPYTFDVSVWEHFWWGICGGSLAVSKPGEHFLPAKILDEVENNKVTHLHFVPSVFELFLNYLENHKDELYKFESVKYVFVSGEALMASLIQRFYAIFSYEKATIHNLYGPTECAVDVTYYDCRPDDIDPVPIGKPIYNTQIHIVDKYNNAVPIGVTGELCIAGDNVGQGYLNNPELTAEKFIDNPFGEGKLYRTGDNAYWREDGNIVFVGRSDFQVKIRGLRIELGEIESALQTVNGIERAVVVVRKDKEDRQLICAFYTGEVRTAKEFRESLIRSLPKYMVPHIFTYLEEMPLTSSGKANRNALPEIDLENISTETEYVAPETEKETLLTESICDVLGAERISALDNFFDIGGDSLKAIELTAKLEEKGYTVAIKTIFSCKDIRELAEKLEAKSVEETVISYDSILPATAAQKRVYTAQMLAPDTTLYNVTYAFKSDNIDTDRLGEAVNKLIERHESLRTHFENRDGVICQVIDERAEISVESIEDINTFTKPFDLSKAPLIRVGQSKETVVIDIHHIIVDGESMPVFFRELNELYMGRELVEEAIQYGEFAVTDTYTENNEKYWLDIFSEETPTLELPTDYPRGAVQSFEGSNLYKQIDITLHRKIEEKCKETGITPYVYYMACFSILLGKLSGNEDIVIGTPISGRQSRYLNTVGMFVNTIALRSRPDGNKKISELLSEIRDSSIEAIDNQNYPFGELVKKLNIEVGGRNPLYDVMLAYQSFEMTDITFGDKKVEPIPLSATNAKCDLTFNILPRENDVVLAAEYCTDLYKEERIENFTKMYVLLLELCLKDEEHIKDISVTDMSLVNSFNDTKADYAKNKCIHELFEEQAEKTPEKVAVVAADKTLTYKELNEEANKIAHSLAEKDVGRGDIVGIMLPRKSCLMAALFGVLKTGAAYLPLDPEYPEERIKNILDDSKAKLCITVDNFNDLIENPDAGNLNNAVKPDDFCYCIYTSGSTGTPKGTLLYHRNLVWYMSVLKKLYGTDNINMPVFTSQNVDLTVPSLYLPLLTGGTAYMYNGELNDDLIEIFSNENLTVVKFTPTHLSIVNKLVPDKYCPNLRCIIVGGESLYRETCVEFLNKFGSHIEIHNEYGPTETTVSCTDYIFRPNENTDRDYLPIGKAVNNVQLYITDKYMQPVPVGVIGELCIAGDGVGVGYINNSELTAERFINNPFGEGKLYRTGDFAYYCEDGNIVFVGREDFQVKIRGLRIELGEIESAIQATEGINNAVVVVRKDKTDKQFICAFYTGDEKSVKELRESLRRSLPKYMVPHIFTHLPEMPLTASGKANRNVLPEIDLENISTDAEYVLPETPEEKALSDAICEVLNLDSVSMQENFFNIGGDSIKAIYIVSNLDEQGYELHVSDVMQKETFSEMAKAMKSTSEKVIYNQKEVNGFIPFTPIMRAYLNENGAVSKNFVHTCTVSIDCDEETAKKALDILVSHHDILRGTICDNGIMVHPSKDREVYSSEYISLGSAEDLKEYLEGKTLDEKLVHITFCNSDDENFISISIHHFLLDLVSWEILIKDFMSVVEQLKNKEIVSLPAKTAAFKLWSEELQKYAEYISDESKSYWEKVNEKLDAVKVLSSDVDESEKTEKISFILDETLTDKLLNNTNYKYGTKTNEVLVTALGLAAAEMAGGSVGIIIEGHGRAELNKAIALERTVGWFTVCYPVVVDNNSNITDELINIKETLRRIPRSGIDYLLLSPDFHKNAEIKFNFYRADNADREEENRYVGFNFNGSVFRNKINVDCSVANGILSVSISVPRGKYEAQFGEQLGMVFREYIEKLVAVCNEDDVIIKTRSDYSDEDLTEAELNELKDLFDWTGGYEQ